MPPMAILQYLLLPLTASFLLLYLSFPRRFRVHRLSPAYYPIYLLALAAGLYFLCILGSLAISKLWCHSFSWPEQCVPPAWRQLTEELPESFRPLPLMTVVIALLIATFENLITLSTKDFSSVRSALRLPPLWRAPLLNIRAAAVAKFMADCNDSRLATVYRAQILAKPLLITLSSRKVYVGIPSAALDPTVDHQFLKILPVASGYRDDKDGTVKLTTFYDEISGALQTAPKTSEPLAVSASEIMMGNHPIVIDTNDIGTLIAWEEVESLFIWDPNLYRLFAASAKSSPARSEHWLVRVVAALTEK